MAFATIQSSLTMTGVWKCKCDNMSAGYDRHCYDEVALKIQTRSII